MGMNHAGEIRALTRIARPEAAVITLIGPAHLEFFDSVDGIADAKAEIFEGLTPDGVAVINADDRYAPRLAAAARAAGARRILRFGAAAEADIRLTARAEDADGARLRFEIGGRSLTARLPLAGAHNAANAAAALAAVAALGLDPESALPGVAGLRPLPGRGATETLALRGGGSLLLID
ncbi:MAG: Mur ligase family protein, partial [Pseudomonadota bacterium]